MIIFTKDVKKFAIREKTKMAKKKASKKADETTNESGLSIKASLTCVKDQFGKKLKVKVSLLQDGNVISEDEDFVKLPLE